MFVRRMVWVMFIVLSLYSISFADEVPTEEPTSPKLSRSAGNGAGPGSLLGSSDTLLFTGSFTYSIPLPVPPGTHGLQPNLTWGYNSSSGNGWCGVGWDLSFGIIQRSTKNGIPTYENNSDGSFKDTFIFSSGGGSQELVKVDTNEYRVKIDSGFMKFVFNPTDNEWTAYDKSGTRYIFGHDWGGSAKVVNPTTINNPPQPNDVFSWSLSSVIDTNDNEIYFFYTHDQNQIYPSAIQYTHHLNEAPPMRWVLFNFEDRTDIITSHRSGFPITTAKRLKTIETKIEDTLVKKYELNYLSHPDTTHSLLTEVKLYGKDETPFPISTSFAYQMNENPGPESESLWCNAGTDNDFYLADFNGDGKMDLANHINGTQGLNVWFSNGSTFVSQGQWLDSSITTDYYHFYIYDFTGDGLVDVGFIDHITENGSTTYRFRVCTNTGSGLQVQQNPWMSWIGPLKKFQFVDFNADGKVDLSWQDGHVLHILLANDSGDSFTDPQPAGWYLPNTEGPFFLFDLNGDGKTDVVRRITDQGSGNTQRGLHVWFKTQDGFEDKGIWLNDTLDTYKIYFADFNGDGLVDLAKNMTQSEDSSGYGGLVVYFNNGRMFGTGATPPEITVGKLWTLAGTGKRNFQLADFNSDGKIDVGRYDHEDANGTAAGMNVMLTEGEIANLLKTVNNPLGGSTTVTYTSSTNNENNTYLPFPIQVVSSVTNDDGMAATSPAGIHSYTTAYTYKGGLYDLKAKEFLGFGEVKAIDGAGNYTITKFKQNEGRNVEITGSGLYDIIFVNPYKGKIAEQTSYNDSDIALAKTSFTYGCSDAKLGGQVTNFTHWYFPYLTRTDNYTYNGGVEKYTAADLSYDGYGNVTSAKSWGEVINNQYTNSGDEVTNTTQYAANTTKYIVGLPKVQQTADSSGNTVAKVEFFYDNKASGEVDRGNLTKKTSGLGSTTSTTMSYDNYGNVLTVTDGNNNTTTIAYDNSLHTFPVTTTNAKGHVSSATYDAGTGNVLTETDANGQTTSYTYDNFGRPLTVQSPIDTPGAPSVIYNYYDTEFPRKVLSRTKQKGGATGDNSTLNYIRVYQFYDGLGRVAQTKTETVSNWGIWIISDCKVYNSRGLVAKAYDSYFPSATPPYTTFTYDALGRVIRQDNADGSYRTITFTGWTETKTDGNGHITDYHKDAFGRIKTVTEHIQGQAHNTHYTYDTLGNLIKIVNAMGETTTITYDSLGRKTAMSDPKMGNWSYSYDASGNLISQTDGKGQIVNLAYDALNRITSKTYPNSTSIIYEYDTATESYSKGRLSKITDTSGYTKFTYDAIGRIVNTDRQIVGKTHNNIYIAQSQYNASGQQTKLTYPNTAPAYSAYDVGGSLLAVHDGTASYAATMLYDHHKQLLRIDYGNNLSMGYQYYLVTARLRKLISGGESGGGTPLPPPPDDPPGTPPAPPDDPGIDPPPPDDGGGGYNPPPPGGGPGGNPPPGGGGSGGEGGWYWPDPTFIRHNPKDFKAFEEFMKTLKKSEEMQHE